MALHIIAIAVYKVEKIDYAYKFEVVDTLNFLMKTKAVLTLKNQYIVHVCMYMAEVVHEKRKNIDFHIKSFLTKY